MDGEDIRQRTWVLLGDRSGSRDLGVCGVKRTDCLMLRCQWKCPDMQKCLAEERQQWCVTFWLRLWILAYPAGCWCWTRQHRGERQLGGEEMSIQ